MLVSQTNMRVLLADDHALFCEGMKHIVSSLDEVDEILEMGSYTYAIENLDEDEYFDVALVALAMPLGWMTLLGCKRCATSRLTRRGGRFSHGRGNAFRQAMEPGASQYIPKTLDCKVVVSAL